MTIALQVIGIALGKGYEGGTRISYLLEGKPLFIEGQFARTVVNAVASGEGLGSDLPALLAQFLENQLPLTDHLEASALTKDEQKSIDQRGLIFQNQFHKG